MASQWEDLKGEIIELYLIQDKSLSQVIEEISRRYGFVRGDRSYREHLAKWGALKTPLKFRDSGYASSRVSAATTPSRPVSTDDVEMNLGTPFATSHPMQDTTQHGPSSDAVSPHPLESDESFANIRKPIPDGDHVRQCNAQQCCDLVRGSNGLPTGLRDFTQEGLDPYTHILHEHPTSTQFQPLSIALSSVHAPISRCTLAREEQRRININIHSCEGCGASKAHHLALIANTIRKQALFERLHSDIDNINHVDNDRNTPLHFLASSGPEPERIQTFQKAGADLFLKNLDGNTMLHVLEPSKLEGPALLELLTWCIGKGFDLKQRNYDGKTILHCLVDRKLSPDDWINVLTALQSITKEPVALDSTHSQIYDYLLARDNQGLNILDSIQAKANASYLQPVIDHFLPNSGRYKGASLVSGNHPLPQFYDQLSIEEQLERDRIMRSTLSRSGEDPSATNPGDGMNALSCLAHIAPRCSDYEMDLQPFFAHEANLKKCLKNGVDPNHYDRHGSPPLHHFLSTFRNNESDEKTADLITSLVFYGADVNARNWMGESGLHVACQRGRVSCVKKLLMFKANPHARDYWSEDVIASAGHYVSDDPENNARIQECVGVISRAMNMRCG